MRLQCGFPPRDSRQVAVRNACFPELSAERVDPGRRVGQMRLEAPVIPCEIRGIEFEAGWKLFLRIRRVDRHDRVQRLGNPRAVGRPPLGAGAQHEVQQLQPGIPDARAVQRKRRPPRQEDRPFTGRRRDEIPRFPVLRRRREPGHVAGNLRRRLASPVLDADRATQRLHGRRIELRRQGAARSRQPSIGIEPVPPEGQERLAGGRSIVAAENQRSDDRVTVQRPEQFLEI